MLITPALKSLYLPIITPFLYKSAYILQVFNNSLCLPTPATVPLLITYILSEFITVDNRWAIISIVYFPFKFSMAFWIFSWVVLSKLLVASSNYNTSVFNNSALAIAIL